MRTVWYIAGVTVLLALAVFILRQSGGKNASPPRVSEAQANALLALLERDPRVRNADTKAAVSQLAALAEAAGPYQAEALLAKGLFFRAQDRMDESSSAFRDAIKLRPAWAAPYNELALNLYGTGRIKEAEENYRKAIELDPAWARAHNDYAVVLRKEGRLDEALAEALTALRLAPDDIASHNNYGNLLVKLGRLEEAEAEYRVSLEMDPGHPIPHYNMACLRSIQGRPGDALGYLETALRLDRRYAEEAGMDPDLEPLRSDPRFQALLRGEGENSPPGAPK